MLYSIRRDPRCAWDQVLCPCISLFALLALGCASSSPFNQNFVELRSPHFHVTSSLGEEWTRSLVRDLETFHAGVLVAVGQARADDKGPPTRVLAFDGRSVNRPFAIRGAPSYLLSPVAGPVLVVRSPGNFRERIDPDLRHRYAHEILRDGSPERPPLWYEEGRARVASTLEVVPGGAQVGRFPADLRALVLGWRRSDWQSVLGRRDLSGQSTVGRERFDAQAWAIVHTLLFDSKHHAEGEQNLSPIRRAFEAGDVRRLDQAVAALGNDEALAARIYAHLERKATRVDQIGVEPFEASSTRLRPAVARDRLGKLALDLGRPRLARDYFERALDDDPDYALSRAGLALTIALEPSGGDLEEMLDAAVALAPEDGEVAQRVGEAYLAWAERDPTHERTGERVERARRYLERSLAGDSDRRENQPEDRPEVMVALARTHLVRGEDAEQARKWLERARRLRPGSIAIDLERARAEIRLGRPRAAIGFLEQALSRSHSAEVGREARALLDAASKPRAN